jgi:predicted nucleic acid-binding protein
MTGKNDTVAWDTCIFLAWLKNETRAPGEMEGIAQSIEAIENNRLNLIASATIFSEMFLGSLPQEVQDQFATFRQRSNVEIAIPADEGINNLAGVLRQFYSNIKDGQPPLATPDAIHLATAITYEVKAFYTFDERGSYRSRGLLPLNGNVAGYKLRIQKPPFVPPSPPDPNQLKLFGV